MIKKILISQPEPSSEKSPYYDIAKDFGVELVFRPFIKVEGLSPKEFRQQKIGLLDYTAVVFTSRHAIDNYFKLAKEMRITIPEDMKYFCVTETIALYIQKYVQYRKRKVFFGNTGKIDSLIPTMVKHKTEKFLVPLSSVHNDDVQKQLDAKKLNHKECVMYRTVSNDFTEEEAKNLHRMRNLIMTCSCSSAPPASRRSQRTSPTSSRAKYASQPLVLLPLRQWLTKDSDSTSRHPQRNILQ